MIQNSFELEIIKYLVPVLTHTQLYLQNYQIRPKQNSDNEYEIIMERFSVDFVTWI